MFFTGSRESVGNGEASPVGISSLSKGSVRGKNSPEASSRGPP